MTRPTCFLWEESWTKLSLRTQRIGTTFFLIFVSQNNQTPPQEAVLFH
jgi:hypothetical protein